MPKKKPVQTTLTVDQVKQLTTSSARVASKEASKVDDARVKRIVAETVKELFTTLGVDIADPIKVQNDFSFLRTLREGSALARTKAFSTVIYITVVALVIALLLGLGVPEKFLGIFTPSRAG